MKKKIVASSTNLHIRQKINEDVLGLKSRSHGGQFLRSASKFLLLAALTASTHSASLENDVETFQGSEETTDINAQYVDEGDNLIDLKGDFKVRNLDSRDYGYNIPSNQIKQGQIRARSSSPSKPGRNFDLDRSFDGNPNTFWRSIPGSKIFYETTFLRPVGIKKVKINWGPTCPIKYTIHIKPTLNAKKWILFKNVDQKARGIKKSLCRRNQTITIDSAKNTQIIRISTSKTRKNQGIAIEDVQFFKS